MNRGVPKVWAVSLQTTWFEFIGTCSVHEADEIYDTYIHPLFASDEHRAKAKDFILKLLTRGKPAVADIVREEIPHYHSIIAIIVHRVLDESFDDISRLGSDTVQSLPAFFELLSSQIPSRLRTPMQQKAFEILWSVAGDNCRPLIGETTDSVWTWYGFLTRDELAIAAEVLREIHNSEDDIDGSAERALFLAWARECARSGKDLFLYTS